MKLNMEPVSTKSKKKKKLCKAPRYTDPTASFRAKQGVVGIIGGKHEAILQSPTAPSEDKSPLSNKYTMQSQDWDPQWSEKRFRTRLELFSMHLAASLKQHRIAAEAQRLSQRSLDDRARNVYCGLLRIFNDDASPGVAPRDFSNVFARYRRMRSEKLSPEIASGSPSFTGTSPHALTPSPAKSSTPRSASSPPPSCNVSQLTLQALLMLSPAKSSVEDIDSDDASVSRGDGTSNTTSSPTRSLSPPPQPPLFASARTQSAKNMLAEYQAFAARRDHYPRTLHESVGEFPGTALRNSVMFGAPTQHPLFPAQVARDVGPCDSNEKFVDWISNMNLFRDIASHSSDTEWALWQSALCDAVAMESMRSAVTDIVTSVLCTTTLLQR